MLLLFLTDSSRNYLDCGGGYEQVVTFLPMRNGKVLPMGRQDTANGEARHCQWEGKILPMQWQGAKFESTKSKGVFPTDTALKIWSIYPTEMSARNGQCRFQIWL